MYGIYIHIPFCIKKCHYCDFASFPDKLKYQDDYINALVDEMNTRKGINADTVYIGGGTPSVLSYENTDKLLWAICKNFVLSKDTEFTIEVNPKTIDEKKLDIFKSYEVNRISMGAQSFVEGELQSIGRIHSALDIEYSFNLLRKHGFDNISLDLMYALPGQTISSLCTSIDKVLKLSPEHISCYGLKYEEGTPLQKMLEKGIVTECSEDAFADMYNYIADNLKKNGYTHYEISNFCKDGKESRHNLKYWLLCDYIGFGVSASSNEGYRRYTHSPYFEDYINEYKLSEDYVMDKEESMSEFVILGLRVLNKGIDKRKFYNKYKVDFDKYYKDALTKVDKYVINDKNTLKLRPEAALVSNSIMCEFIR